MPVSTRPFALALRAGLISALAALPASAFRIAKGDFPRFAGTFDCQWDGEACPGAGRGFLVKGLVGG
jgi:hypothetical protein